MMDTIVMLATLIGFAVIGAAFVLLIAMAALFIRHMIRAHRPFDGRWLYDDEAYRHTKPVK